MWYRISLIVRESSVSLEFFISPSGTTFSKEHTPTPTMHEVDLSSGLFGPCELTFNDLKII